MQRLGYDFDHGSPRRTATTPSWLDDTQYSYWTGIAGGTHTVNGEVFYINMRVAGYKSLGSTSCYHFEFAVRSVINFKKIAIE